MLCSDVLMFCSLLIIRSILPRSSALLVVFQRFLNENVVLMRNGSLSLMTPLSPVPVAVLFLLIGFALQGPWPD